MYIPTYMYIYVYIYIYIYSTLTPTIRVLTVLYFRIAHFLPHLVIHVYFPDVVKFTTLANNVLTSGLVQEH